MDSVKVFNGYGKVNNLEDQFTTTIHSNNIIIKNRKKSLITVIAISCIFILTLIIGTMMLALIHESNTEEESETESLSSDLNSNGSIKLICNVTHYPNTCFTSINSLNSVLYSNSKLDPVSVFKISLKVSITELSSVSSFIETLNPDQALRDCDDLLSDALSRLNDSAAVMEIVGTGGKVFTKKMISDMRTWVSAALTDQETCTDGLEEMESAAATEVKKRVDKSKEYVSNTLAILANMNLLLEKFGITLR